MNKNENLEIARVHEKVTLRKEKFAKKWIGRKNFAQTFRPLIFQDRLNLTWLLRVAVKLFALF